MILPFLPEDNASLDEHTVEALQTISNDLADLLSLDPGAFWKRIRADDTLHACLTSYLQFARCRCPCLPACKLSACVARAGTQQL